MRLLVKSTRPVESISNEQRRFQLDLTRFSAMTPQYFERVFTFSALLDVGAISPLLPCVGLTGS
jgi:hypothetical protein